MGADARKRQKKLERRSARRKEKKHDIIRRQSAGLADRLTAAAGCPILDCWVSDSLEPEGIGQVGLSRLLPNGSVAIASFLVDRHCLGVKDAHADVLPRSEYDHIYRHELAARLPSRPLAPADARKLVEAAVTYARGIGFPPHPDYARAKLLFGSIDAAEGVATIEFGKDGRPFFISGPDDTPARCRQIVTILTNTCGPGNFEYMIGVGPTGWDDEADAEELDALDEWDEEGDK
jgi:hypothetical protein